MGRIYLLAGVGSVAIVSALALTYLFEKKAPIENEIVRNLKPLKDKNSSKSKESSNSENSASKEKQIKVEKKESINNKNSKSSGKEKAA